MNLETPLVQLGPSKVVVCCRQWTVYVLWPVGPCGLCGQVPK